MSILAVDEAESRAKEIAAFAAKPENWYRIGETTEIPGNQAEFVLRSGTIRAVFTWTKLPEGEVYRHMTVSTMGPAYPNPVIVWTLAHMFGFTGAKVDKFGAVFEPSKTWGAVLDEDEHCIVVQEKVTTASPPEVV